MSNSERLVGPALVTGGAGFIGSALIKKLAATYPDLQIVSLDNYSTGKESNHLAPPQGTVRYVRGDTKDIYEVWESLGLSDPSIIFHLGEQPRVKESYDKFRANWLSNVVGMERVVSFAAERKAFLLYSASSSGLGNEGRDKHKTPYSWTKAQAVDFIKNMSEWFPFKDGDKTIGKSLEYAITYFYNVYGPGHIREGEGKTVIGIWEKQLMDGRKLTIVRPGTQERDFTHIDDVVTGIILVAEQGWGDNYHLGRGNPHQIKDIALMFVEGDRNRLEWLESWKGDREKGRAPSSRATDLGWEPKLDIENYIRRFVASLEQNQ